jgi:hypothetical protein
MTLFNMWLHVSLGVTRPAYTIHTQSFMTHLFYNIQTRHILHPATCTRPYSDGLNGNLLVFVPIVDKTLFSHKQGDVVGFLLQKLQEYIFSLYG